MQSKNSDFLKEADFHEGVSRENNVICFLQHHAQSLSGRTALEWVPREIIKNWDGVKPLLHTSINHADLYKKICAVSSGLQKNGIIKGDRVIIFVPLSPELYITMFAVQRLGAISVFLDSWARKDHLGICAQVVEPKAMISFEKAFQLCAAVPELANIQVKVVVGPHENNYPSDLESLLRSPDSADIEPVESNDTALITFTTGSSGVPKGADRTHRFLAAQHRALDKEIPYKETDRDLPVFPIFSLNNLAGGVTTVLPAIDLAVPSDKDASIIINQLFSAQITCCTVSPSIFVNIAEYCRKNQIILNNLRRVVTGGAPVSKDNVRDFKAIAPEAEILVLYGSTEVEPIAHIEAKEMLGGEDDRQGVNVGKISEDLDYKFIKIWRKNVELGAKGWQEWEVETGKPGELVVSGAHVCENYYNNLEAFKATKIKESTGRIWHRTGDVGILDEQGRLWLVGRVHNTIVRENEYLFPVHAEILLKRLDFVRQAAFLGIEDAKLGEKACAVFSVKEGFKPDNLEEYTNAIKSLLAENKIPVDRIDMVKEIPMDPRHHSKVEYTKLKEIIIQNV
ncbi:MAG: AMP-binding protein [Candidatus Omnitrophica bacterium]|nr:AMP-binding protein [Candidatus Omnitrophota bacterium]